MILNNSGSCHDILKADVFFSYYYNQVPLLLRCRIQCFTYSVSAERDHRLQYLMMLWSSRILSRESSSSTIIRFSGFFLAADIRAKQHFNKPRIPPEKQSKAIKSPVSLAFCQFQVTLGVSQIGHFCQMLNRLNVQSFFKPLCLIEKNIVCVHVCVCACVRARYLMNPAVLS